MNEGGSNQFGGDELQPKYGQVKRLTQLTREAPISGAPYAAQALNTPRRSQRSAVRGGTPHQQQPEPVMPPEQPQLPPERIYQAIADLPGMSDTVKAIFSNA